MSSTSKRATKTDKEARFADNKTRTFAGGGGAVVVEEKVPSHEGNMVAGNFVELSQIVDASGRPIIKAVEAMTAKAKPASLAQRARQAMEAITEEEDAAITAGARTDPDAQPNRLLTKRLGRPRAAVTKQAVMLRLDPDVILRFKADGDGWQTRMNDALRKAVGLG